MGQGISFVWGDNDHERDVQKAIVCDDDDDVRMPGGYPDNTGAPSTPLDHGAAEKLHQETIRQEPAHFLSPQATEACGTALSESGTTLGGEQATPSSDDSMFRLDVTTVPVCSNQVNLQGSTLSGNPTIVAGNLTNVTGNTFVFPPVPSPITAVPGAPGQHGDQETILDWLAPKVNFRSIHIENLEKCAEGTLSWFLRGDDYTGWKFGNHKIIWGTGIPGAGKTVLASRLINDLESIESPPGQKICILYAYCRYTEALTVKDVLEGLVKQCLERHAEPGIVASIVPILERHRREKTRPSFNELMDHLRIIESHFDVVFYIIDGLDEARVSTQFNLIKVINSLSGRFAITSRPLRMLEGDLPSAAFYPVCARREDIMRLIQVKIAQHSHLRALLELKGCEARVLSQILDKSGGMFIHAALQVQALAFCRNLKDVEDVLNNLPVSLKDMYRQTIQRIKAQSVFQADLGMRALLWVVFSQGHEPLRIDDVLYAVAADPETYVFNEEKLVDQATLISACCGLIEVDSWGHVRLAHYTAQEALATILLEDYPHPHAVLVQALMQRLISLDLPQSHVEDEEELETILKHPLAGYAYDNWNHHFQHCKHLPEIASKVLQFVQRCTSFPLHPVDLFLDPETPLLKLNPLHVAAVYDLTPLVPKLVAVDGTLRDGLYSVNSATDPDSITPLLIASSLGHVGIMEELLGCSTIDPNLLTKHGSVLVQAVRAYRRPALVRLLQVKGIQVNAADQWGKTALIHAVSQRSAPLVQELLQHPDIDVNARDNNGDTALIHASRTTYSAGLDIVRLLLRARGIQVSAANRKGDTALIVACGAHYPQAASIVEELLKCDSLDVNAANEAGDTALICAARSRSGPTVRRLLQVDGIQVNTANRKGQTALMAACKRRDGLVSVEEVVQELLKSDGLDVNARDEEGYTALILATRRNLPTIVGELLRFKAVNVAAVDKEGNTAATLACRWGLEDVAQQLFQADETVLNMANALGQTPLIVASTHGHTNTVLRLLQSGKVDVNAVDKSGSTALSAAFAHRHWRIVTHLLRAESIQVNIPNDMDINAADEEGNTALILAACDNLADVVHRLLPYDHIQVNVANRNGHTALMLASCHGCKDIVKALLRVNGINVTAVDGGGNTAVLLACAWGHADIVEQLVQADETVLNISNSRGQTPLIVASSHGHTATVQRLLQSGKVEVNAVDSVGSTALSEAFTHRHWSIIVHLLQASGIQGINVPNNTGQTLLMHASMIGKDDIVRLLLRLENIDVNANLDLNGETALILAVVYGHLSIVQMLLAHGATDVNATDRFGRTALIHAIAEQREDVVEAVLGTDRALLAAPWEGKNGIDAVGVALMIQHEGIMRLLDEYRSRSTSS